MLDMMERAFNALFFLSERIKMFIFMYFIFGNWKNKQFCEDPNMFFVLCGKKTLLSINIYLI